MIQSLYRLMIELTNQKWSSNLLKRFAQSPASKFVIPSFARLYNINLEEMQKGIREYESLHDFFIRRLKPSARVITDDTAAVVSPVDAMLEDIGRIESEHQITVKGKVYSIAEMLGSREAADVYKGGTYMVLYLSPSNYHRIHSPVTGKILKQWSLGARSYPVNSLGLKYGKSTLAKNYRTITEMEYEKGRLAVVKVGAMFVNSIETVHKGDWLQKGEEMAYFTFGSTVVLLFQKDGLKLPDSINLPSAIRMGEKLGE